MVFRLDLHSSTHLNVNLHSHVLWNLSLLIILACGNDCCGCYGDLDKENKASRIMKNLIYSVCRCLFEGNGGQKGSWVQYFVVGAPLYPNSCGFSLLTDDSTNKRLLQS